jgi:hypothetical protein
MRALRGGGRIFPLPDPVSNMGRIHRFGLETLRGNRYRISPASRHQTRWLASFFRR